MPSKKPGKSSKLRDGAIAVKVFNSGLEVWLYDEQNLTPVRESGAMAAFMSGDDSKIKALFRAGQVVGYSLYQDDELRIGVIVGPPLTTEELSVAHWLKPQTAFLRLPSGRLCIESNDALRFGEEEAGDEGAIVTVPPGDYGVTLYRIDHEALEREDREWKGPQEVVVLTPGGSPGDAAEDFLPFEQLRDTTWIGAYRIEGRKFEGLIWFPDFWETFAVNLDRAAAERLGLAEGQYLRITAPATGLSFLTVFAPSWDEGRKLALPAGKPPEYAYGAINPMADWNGAEAFTGRREIAGTAIKAAHKNIWLPVTVEVLDLPLAQPPARIRGPLIHDAGKRVFFGGTLAERTYFDQDKQFLTARLMSRVPDVPWGEPMELPVALAKVDAAYAAVGLHPLGDFSFDVTTPRGAQEYTNRLYGGLPDVFGVIWGSVATLVFFYFSRLANGRWVLTGAIPQNLAQAIERTRPQHLSVRGADGSLEKVFAAHREHLRSLDSPAGTLPTTLEAMVKLYEDYLVKALD
jgi:hypothetical protein